MFIDVHAHAYRPECPLADGRTRFATPDEVLRRYDELGIERGVLHPLIGPEVYLPQSNEDILDMCERSGGRLVPFCNIDPRGISNSPDAPLGDWLRHYKRKDQSGGIRQGGAGECDQAAGAVDSGSMQFIQNRPTCCLV